MSESTREMTHEAQDVINRIVGGNVDYFVVPTQVGWLVAFRSGDSGIFDEISVDLVTPDGRAMQLSVTGYDCRTDDEDDNEDVDRRRWDPDYQRMHVLFWDGTDWEGAQRVNVSLDDDRGYYC